MDVSATTQSRRSHRTATAFEQYVSGRRAAAAGTAFFLDCADHLGEVLAIAGENDTLFAPTVAAEHEESPGTPRVVGYDGSFVEPGDEMTLDGRHTFELQDYLAAPFISIVGLTVVRQGSAAGIAAFLSDADSAREAGLFVDQLRSSAVLLDSRASFVEGAPADAGLVRVHVSTTGEYRDGADGLLLGQVGDPRSAIEEAAASGARRGRPFARIVDSDELEAALDARPWLGRYVAALDLLRQWDGAPTGPSISGFGGHLVAALDDDRDPLAIVSADAPFLLTGHDDEYILVDRETRRRFRLGVDAARGAECLIATGDEAAAAGLLAAELGRARHEADTVIRDLRSRFLESGVDLTAYAGRAA